MAKPASFAHLTATLHSVANDPQVRWIWTKHGLDEMADRKPPATVEDVIRVLRRGRVTWVEFKKDELWRVEGHDLDDIRLQVIVAVYEREIRIKIVTAF